jgi:hypothetical protein
VARISIDASSFRHGLNSGDLADVVLTYAPRDTTEMQTVRLLEAVEVMGIRPDPTSLNPSGAPNRWECSLLVSDAQAEAIELARRTQSSSLIVTPRQGDFEDPQSAQVEPQLLDWLKREAQPAEPSSDPTDA